MGKLSNNNNSFKLGNLIRTFQLGILPIAIFALLGMSTFTYFYMTKQKVNIEVDNVASENLIEINIPQGSTTRDIAVILKNEGLVSSTLTFRIISRFKGFDGKYKKGIHVVNKEMSYIQLCEALCQQAKIEPGERITLIEGLAFEQMVNKLENNKLIDKDKFIDIVNNQIFDYKFLDGLRTSEHRKYRLEGYLFPDTYEFDKTYDEYMIINKMLARFNEMFEQEYYNRTKQLNMTIDEVITLASIIEREAQAKQERTIISSVFHNRLKSKDYKRFESCATVQYVLGTNKERLSDKDTAIDSPYNTYIYEGFPPGPICSPGKDSIRAALYPDDTEYLFFAADGNGTHIFSKNFRDHINASNRISLNKR